MSSLTAPSGTASSVDNSYVLASIDTAPAPLHAVDDSAKLDWYRYVIRQGSNEIVGHRRGSRDDVRQAVETLVAQLNSRLHLKPGRVQLTIGPTKKS